MMKKSTLLKKVSVLMIMGMSLTVMSLFSGMSMGCGSGGGGGDVGDPSGSGGSTILGSGGSGEGSGGILGGTGGAGVGSGGSSSGSGGVAGGGGSGGASVHVNKVVTGDAHTCALLSDGTVKCWGKNELGQLGDGTFANSDSPRLVSDLRGVVDLAAGLAYTCALLSDGTVKCWGKNEFGQLGDGTTTSRPTPVAVGGGLNHATSLAAGSSHTCATVGSGDVKCWGSNSSGQLGDGTTTSRPTPVAVGGGLTHAIFLAAGDAHTCALLGSGDVNCWGENSDGQLGDGTTTSRPTPVAVGGGLNHATSLVAGAFHTCALLSDGTVKCWGYNFSGQLGDGTTTSRPTPVAVGGGLNHATSLAAGSSHTCANVDSGGVKCWGRNDYGQLGDGTTTSRSTPTSILSLTGISSLAAGSSHTCAILGSGGVKCWGSNIDGQLANGEKVYVKEPQSVDGLTHVAGIEAGSNHVCVFLDSGNVECWGKNEYGQLGNGTLKQGMSPELISRSDLSGVTSLAAGTSHTCALLGSGSVKCWGSNSSGQLGVGTTDSFTPVDLGASVTDITSLTAGNSHACALLGSGSVKCWGSNSSGQLGDGTTTQSYIPIPTTSDLTGVRSLTSGFYHTCSLLSDETVKCWGDNSSSQLGDGTTTQRNAPTLISADILKNVKSLASGSYYTCSLLSDETVKCWGDNSYGQLGDGTTIQRNTPTPITGLTGVSSLTAGYAHTCSLLNNHTVRCWGDNSYGQLGDGTMINELSPTPVSGISNALAITAGDYHTCALLSDNTVKCWGWNGYNQLGDGEDFIQEVPANVLGL